jgi:hypothetical protein
MGNRNIGYIKVCGVKNPSSTTSKLQRKLLRKLKRREDKVKKAVEVKKEKHSIAYRILDWLFGY